MIGPDGFTRLAPTVAGECEHGADYDHIAQAVTTLREWERRAHRGTVTLDPEEISDLADLLSSSPATTGEGDQIEHHLVRNGEDALDTCTGCGWESWDTAPSFEEHASQSSERCVVCSRSAPHHGGLCCFHKYDEQPTCDHCAADEEPR